MHRDQWAFDFFSFPTGYEVTCNTIWAMTDFTEANGATRLIPGSHRFDDKLRFTEADTEPAEMRKGSVLIYTGALYHGGGPEPVGRHPPRREHHVHASGGCARRRTSTSRCRPRSRATCPTTCCG